MINRVRTLLMNRGRDGYDLQLPGEEYIAADYVCRAQPVWLQRIYKRLFGASPDRLFINYRMRQLMQLIHATPLAEFVSPDNVDITYLPFRDELDSSLFRQTMRPLAGDSPTYLHGQHTADDAIGQTTYIWDVRLIASDTVRITTRVPEESYVDVPVVFSNDLSNQITLIPRKLTTSFNSAAPGFGYQVQSVVRPAVDITAVLTSACGTAEGLDDRHMFAPGLSGEQTMYYDIWRRHPQFVMRYAALLLAIANFTESQETSH